MSRRKRVPKKGKFRLHIAGEWTARDFSNYFSAVNSISEEVAYLLDQRGQLAFIAPMTIRPNFVRDMREGGLRVDAVEFASPGFTDFAGLGSVVKEVREFLQFLISHFSGTAERQLSNEARKIEIAKKKIELVERIGSMNVKPEIREMLVQNTLDREDLQFIATAIGEGRITRVDEAEFEAAKQEV